jgi:hypothetical protein
MATDLSPNSQSLALIHLAPTLRSAVNKIRDAFPAGMLDANVTMREFLVAGESFETVFF